MILLRTKVAPSVLILSMARLAAAQAPAEPPPPPSSPPPPPVYNPPPPPPYSGPPLVGTGDIPRFHDRFYLRLSMGGGSMGTSGSLDPDNGSTFETRGAAFAFDLAIGGTPVPGFVIGGDYAFQEAFRPHFKVSTPGNSFEADSDSNTVFGVFGVFADWFPDPAGGFHFGGTLGYAVLSVTDQSGSVSNDVSEKGFGGALRVGYDAWVSNQWSLGVLGQFVGGRVSSDSTSSGTERDTVTSFAVLFTALYH